MADVRFDVLDRVEAVELVDFFGVETFGRAATVRLLLLTGRLTLDLDRALRLAV